MSEDGRCPWLSREQMCPRVGGHQGGMLACLPGELTVPVGVHRVSSLWGLGSCHYGGRGAPQAAVCKLDTTVCIPVRGLEKTSVPAESILPCFVPFVAATPGG